MDSDPAPGGGTPARRPEHESVGKRDRPEAEPAPLAPDTAGGHPRPQRSAIRWAITWGAAVVVIAALVVPPVVATEDARRAGADATLEDFTRLQPGTTWVFQTSTNGKDTGTDVEQITGPALPSNLAPHTVQLTDNFENFLGSGTPSTTISYIGLLGKEVVRYGSRTGDFTPSEPPEILLRLPLSKGSHWTWRGSAASGTGVTTSSVTDVADRTVLGRHVSGCVRVHAVSHDKDAQGTPSTDVTDTWFCPGIGVVEQHEDFEKAGERTVLDERLIGFHAPGENLGPAAPATGGPGIGGTAAVDQGRSGFVPRARLSVDGLAWSFSRRENILYAPVGSGDDMVLAEDDGTVSSTDLRTGRVLWQVTLTQPIVAPPVVAGSLVLVGDGSKTLWALDAETGAARWAVPLPDVLSTSPVVQAGIVVVAVDDLSVRGLDTTTGRQRWSISTPDLVIAPPVVAGGRILLGSRDGTVTAVSGRDGSVIWQDSFIQASSGGNTLLGGLAARGDVAVATTDGATLIAYDAATGHIRWRASEPHSVDLPPAIAGDRAIVVASSTVEARDLRTGRSLWSVRVGGATSVPPVVLGDTVAVLQPDNRLVLLNLADGAARVAELKPPEAGLEQDTQVPMAWVGGALVVPTHNGGPWPFTILQAFPAPAAGSTTRGAPNGVRLAGSSFDMGAQPAGPPMLDRGVLYAAVQDSVRRIVKGKPVDVSIGKIVREEPARGAISGPPPSTISSYQSPGLTQFAIPADNLVLAESGTRLVAVPRSGGDPVWSFDTGQLFPGTRPLVVGHTVIVPRPGKGLSGLDLATGKPVWPDIPVTGPLAVGTPHLLPSGDVVWGGAGITVLDPKTGKVVNSTTKLTPAADLAVDGAIVFAVAFVGSRTALVQLDTSTFTPTWAKPFAFGTTFNGALAVGPGAGSGVVVAVDAHHVVHAFDEQDGSELWSLQLRTAPSSAPLVVGGRVYVQEPGLGENLIDQHDDRVTVLDARSGAMEAVWELPGVNIFGGTFTVSGDVILTGAPTGTYAIRPERR